MCICVSGFVCIVVCKIEPESTFNQNRDEFVCLALTKTQLGASVVRTPTYLICSESWLLFIPGS